MKKIITNWRNLILKEEKKVPLKIAHVGSTKEHAYHKEDMRPIIRWVINSNDVKLLDKWKEDKDSDYWELQEGRDFLNPENELAQYGYDVVVLHRIYTECYDDNVGIFSVSERSSRDAWREALKKASPEYIFAVGSSESFCISGKWLGDIEGYTKEFEDRHLTVWKDENK